MSANTTIQVLHLLAPLVALATMAASHAVLCRIRPDAAILNLLVVAGFAGLGGLFVMQLLALFAGQTLGGAFAAMMLVDGPIYACLAYGYANFVNLGHASVRIRIYRELLDSPQGIKSRNCGPNTMKPACSRRVCGACWRRRIWRSTDRFTD